MNATIQQTLQDLKARQNKHEHMICPRCGHDTMDVMVTRNALSRYADLHICSDCGIAEAMLDMMRNPLPIDQWACIRRLRPQFDFKALPGSVAYERLRKDQVPYLTRLFEMWNAQPECTDFDEYRFEAHLNCGGLEALWSQPFRASYKVADGELVIRFRATDTGTEVAIDIIPKP